MQLRPGKARKQYASSTPYGALTSALAYKKTCRFQLQRDPFSERLYSIVALHYRLFCVKMQVFSSKQMPLVMADNKAAFAK